MAEQVNYNEQWKNAMRDLRFSKLTDVQILNLASNTHTSVIYTKYTKENIIKYLKNPETNAKQLRYTYMKFRHSIVE